MKGGEFLSLPRFISPKDSKAFKIIEYLVPEKDLTRHEKFCEMYLEQL